MIMKDWDQDYTRRTEQLMQRNQEIQDELNKARITEESLWVKEREYAGVKKRLDEVERLNMNLQANTEIKSETVQKVNNRQEVYENQIKTLWQEIDLLNQDKTFLTRESLSLHDWIKRLEDQLDKQHDELMEAKRNA